MYVWHHSSVVKVLLFVEQLCLTVPAPLRPLPRSGELWTQKLKSHLVRTYSLNVLPLKRGAGQYIAIYATLTARDFFLANFYPSGLFTCILSKTSPEFFPVLAVANTGSCVGPQNKIGHPVWMQVPVFSSHGI